MLRSPLYFGCLALIAAAGCGSGSAPPAPVASGPKEVKAPDSASVEPPAPAPAPTTSAPGSAAPISPPTAASGLRGLLVRYLEADGQGGFRPNEQAATELEKQSPSADELLAHLADPQVEVRRSAAFALLGLFDPAISEQRAAFTALLGDADRTIRGMGLAAVKQMPADDQLAALPQLTAMLDHQREDRGDNRASVARLLGGLKTAAATGMPALLAAVRADPEGKVRAACLAAVAQIAPAADAVAPLTASLSDKDPAVRIVASAQLRRIGAASAPAATQLSAALGDGDQRVRENAAEALILIGAPAVPAISGVLSGDKVEARKYALAALAKIGPPAKPAIPAIEKCLQDSDPAVSKLAAQALKQIGAP